MSPDDDTNAIELLRSERPEPDTDPGLRAPRVTRPTREVARTVVPPRRRHTRRIGIAAALAAAVVLAGLQVVTSRDSGAPSVRTISVAEAKQIAVSALEGVDELKNYRMVQIWSATEVGGEERVVSRRTETTVFDGDRSGKNHSRNDFVDQDIAGAEFRTVAGRTYIEGKSPYVEQRWVLPLKTAPSIGGFDMPPPETAGIIAQLDREGLITAQRTESGAVVVEVKRPAGELQDVDGMMSSRTFGDPITMFATGIARSGHPEVVITARLTISADGDLRGIRVSARNTGELPDGKGGIEVLSDTVNEWKLSPATAPITAPDPSDVMVVGDIMRMRRGATGVDGPHKTLDTYTAASLGALRQRVRSTSPGRGADIIRRPGRPARDYTAHFKRVAAKQRLMRAELRTMQRDAAALSQNDRCTPFWPDTGRAMDVDTAQAKPTAAGWRCKLETVEVYVSTEPGARGWSWEFIGGGGGGCCISEKDIAAWRN